MLSEFITVDWKGLAERAKGMSDEELRGAIKDAFDAGLAAWDLEKSGLSVSKTQGYYHDEISVYRHEIAERNRREQNLGVL
jgi:hypothetical protein